MLLGYFLTKYFIDCPVGIIVKIQISRADADEPAFQDGDDLFSKLLLNNGAMLLWNQCNRHVPGVRISQLGALNNAALLSSRRAFQSVKLINFVREEEGVRILKMDLVKASFGLLSGIARSKYYGDDTITQEFLRQELFPDLGTSGEGFAPLELVD